MKKPSETEKAANIVIDLALASAKSDGDFAAIQKIQKIFDPNISYMDLSDDEAGRYMKWVGEIIRSFAEKEFDDHDGTGTALTTMGMLQVFRRMFDAKAHHGTFVIKRATFAGVDGGNWQAILQQIDDDGNPISVEEETTSISTTMDPINPEPKATVEGSGRA